MHTPLRYTAVLLLAALSGCVSTAPNFDQGFGNSVRAAVAAQVIDPAAARNPNPVAGIDGRAAVAAQHDYVRAFSTPQAAPRSMIDSAGK